MKIKPVIRAIKQSEISFLDEMLYEAIFIPEGVGKLPENIIYQPELFRYIKDFGKYGDICLIAEIHEKLIGAIWTRLFSEHEKGFGYVDENTPELSMAVNQQYRNQGIGKKLIEELFHRITAEGFKQVSLSVNKQNYAFDFYLSNGFEIFDSTDKSVTMIKRLINYGSTYFG